MVDALNFTQNRLEVQNYGTANFQNSGEEVASKGISRVFEDPEKDTSTTLGLPERTVTSGGTVSCTVPVPGVGNTVMLVGTKVSIDKPVALSGA